MEASVAGLIGAAIGVAGTLGVEALRAFAARLDRKATEARVTNGYFRENLIGLQEGMLSESLVSDRIVRIRKVAGVAPDDLLSELVEARADVVRFLARVREDDLREMVSTWMEMAPDVLGQAPSVIDKQLGQANVFLANKVNARLGEILRSLY